MLILFSIYSDPNSIPVKKWSEYESELWEKQTVVSSHHSEYSERSHASRYSASGAPPYNATGYGGAPMPTYGAPRRPSSAYGGSVYSATGSVPKSQVYDSRPLSMGASQVTGPTDYTGYTSMNGMAPPPSYTNSTVAVAPNDGEILNEIRHILSTANLMTVT